MIDWPSTLIDGLVADGRRVIVFDSRDAGTSTHFSQHGFPDFAAVFGAVATGAPPPLAYQAADLVEDARAVLAQAGADKAEVLGVSGGATVAALLAIEHPDLVSGLVLVMANSGNPALPLPADPARLAAVPPPAEGTRGQLIEARVATERALANIDDLFDENEVRARAARAIDRDSDPFGAMRQGVTLLVLGDLRSRLEAVTAPTVVVHGVKDPLLSLAAGQEVSAAIPGATFIPVEAMGHTLAPRAIPVLREAVRSVSAGR